jgi:hypothetical protein
MATKFEGQDRRVPERWKITKEVSVADLVSVVLAFGAVFAAFNNLDKRVDGLERMAPVQAITDKKQDDDSQRYQARIDKSLDEINRKLDRLMERK